MVPDLFHSIIYQMTKDLWLLCSDAWHLCIKFTKMGVLYDFVPLSCCRWHTVVI